MLEGENQFGFQLGVGCQRMHHLLPFLLIKNFSKGKSIYLCALDLSKAIDVIRDCQSPILIRKSNYDMLRLLPMEVNIIN